MKALGDWIGGRFVAPVGRPLVSHNPARGGAVVLETACDEARVADACAAAAEAWPAWQALGLEGRYKALARFRDAISAHSAALAEAITLEMGKLHSEAQGEVKALVGRFDLVYRQVKADLSGGPLAGFPDEELHYRPHGVVAVIGPFNFPLHLCHAHVVPALLTGNTVVIKPSDVTPLCGQRYAEAAQAAGLPPGVLNVVNGDGLVGAALVSNPHVRGLCFTGSYEVGHRITRAALDRPELLVALEMGGKNTVVVLDDADLRHAAHDIAIGGYLTTGQRCTCTDRVLVQRGALEGLMEALAPLTAAVRFGDPHDEAHFGGPLATATAREKFLAAVARGRAGGAELIASSDAPEGGGFVGASLHLLPEGVHDIPGYTDTELFGPDLHVEVVEDEDEAAAIIGRSPFGLANSVFTAERARFERVYDQTVVGILNWNRTTNQASPRLPFGGVGRSGNFRPAGSFAARNTVLPVAVKTALPGEFEPHAKLEVALVAPDLAQIEARHDAEEAAEARRTLLSCPRPLWLGLPAGGKLPESDAWRRRLYARDRMAREKKPGVFDHLRSFGPWMVSVDDEPLSVLDAMSQTSTLPAGFAPDPVVTAYVEGGFGDTPLRGGDTTMGHPSAVAFAEVLRRALPELPEATFTNSGAEANEKAFALCRLHAPEGADRVLVFEGSFHGRTMLALHSTWNPSKRAPFEIPGYESSFAPFPLWDDPHQPQPEAPEGFLAAAASGDIAALEAMAAQGDALLGSEVASLARVHEVLSTGRIFAVNIEPMQSEGGDRYATARFFKALRLLTRHHGVSLIFDEVQCGFGLGQTFFWFEEFGLVDAEGGPDWPDVLVVAKRAQLGVVLSRWPDPEPTAAHAASLVRGRIHAEMVLASHDDYARVEALVRPRLEEIARRYPELVSRPRVHGYAFAFDLPSDDLLAPYYLQRFWRGAVVFGAGTRTVRYRLSSAFTESDIDMVFDAMRRSLSWLDAHPGKTPPAWEDMPEEADAQGEKPEVRVRVVDPTEAEEMLPRIVELEERVYEPARRDPPELLRKALDNPDGVVVVAEVRQGDGWYMVGSALASPLEIIRPKDGVMQDPMRGRHNTLHSQALTVDPAHQGLGLGQRLKEMQIARAAEMTRPDGSPRYDYISGRNRIGFTKAMRRLNRRFGAHVVAVYDNQYGVPDGEALYYRQPVRRRGANPDPERSWPASTDADLATGVADPLAHPPESLVAIEAAGLLQGPSVTKITICNYITPAVVRAAEYITALIPERPHLYLTSGRDEGVDKSIRTLRYHRRQATVVIGLAGGYVGHTSSGARSVSDPATHRMGPPYFEWPRVPHPEEVGANVSLEAIRRAVDAAGGPQKVLGLFLEPLQERTGRVIPSAFWRGLEAMRAELDLPLVLFETASAPWRAGQPTPFLFQSQPVEPDIVAWWGGGQAGFVHLNARYFIDKPLMMVSTWDGDELSMVRLQHQLRAARQLDLGPAIEAMGKVARATSALGMESFGQGLYRVIHAGERAEWLNAGLRARGVRLRPFPGGRLGVIPHMDTAQADLTRLAGALEALGAEEDP